MPLSMPPANRLAQKGTVYLVGAGPGAADLLTLRGFWLLQTASVIVHDSLVSPEMYRDLPAERIDAGKRSGNHGLNQTQINQLLIDLARQNHAVVRLKGGDPYVLGRGSEEALALAQVGVPCEVIPGVSSALAAPLLSGIPLTHRGLADSFCVVSAHPQHEGQLPAIPPYDPRRTLVILMGVQTAEVWLQQLEIQGYPRDLPLAFAKHASWPEAQTWTTTLGNFPQDLLLHPLTAPAVAIIGHVVSLRNSLPHEAP